MKKTARIAGMLSVLLASQEAVGQVASVGIATPPPNSLGIGGQYYDASVSGVRNLVETYRESSPDLYARLTTKADRLAAMKTRAWIVGCATAAVGLAAVVGGFALYDPNVPQGKTPDSTPILIGVTVGIPLVLLSPLIGYALAPSRADYMDFVNYHNRLNPRKQLYWQVGWDTNGRAPTIAAAWQLDVL